MLSQRDNQTLKYLIGQIAIDLAAIDRFTSMRNSGKFIRELTKSSGAKLTEIRKIAEGLDETQRAPTSKE